MFNRSLPWEDPCKGAINVLINLIKYNRTMHTVLKVLDKLLLRNKHELMSSKKSNAKKWKKNKIKIN